MKAFQDIQSLFMYCLHQPTVVHKNPHDVYYHFINVFVFNNKHWSQSEAVIAIQKEGTAAAKDKAKVCLIFESARGKMEKMQKRFRTLQWLLKKTVRCHICTLSYIN